MIKPNIRPTSNFIFITSLKYMFFKRIYSLKLRIIRINREDKGGVMA